MQNRVTSATQPAGWGSQPNGLSSPGQAVHLPGLNATSWQTGPTPQWGPPAPQPGMPTLRAIMQEEQQAALQGRSAISHTTGSINASINGSAGDTRQLPPPMNMAQQYPVHVQQQQVQQQQQQQQQHQQQQQMQQPQQYDPQQQQQPQRSGGFYMRNKRDDSVPVKGNWAQALNRPPVEAPSNPPGMAGFGNGLVDLQMATEAFRDAFSATAPSMKGPLERDQDPLLAEAYKSQANPITGTTCALNFATWPCSFLHARASSMLSNPTTMHCSSMWPGRFNCIATVTVRTSVGLHDVSLWLQPAWFIEIKLKSEVSFMESLHFCSIADVQLQTGERVRQTAQTITSDW